MANVSTDQLIIFRIEGMHCHQCERKIRQALTKHPGVHEVEVDFASGQASVLLERGTLQPADLMSAINEAGYRAMGFTQGEV